jgi:hypothetical protein
MEVWKTVTELGENYEVSSTGKVRRVKSQRVHILTPIANHRGYLRVCMSFRNKNYARSVHRLVADAFLEKKGNGNVVNHIDGNKLNNNYENLEWTSQQKNHLHALALEKTQRCKSPRGAYQREYIRKDGSTKKVWYSQIAFNHEKKKLGVFETKHEAQLAFKKAFTELYGFPPWRLNE